MSVSCPSLAYLRGLPAPGSLPPCLPASATCRRRYFPQPSVALVPPSCPLPFGTTRWVILISLLFEFDDVITLRSALQRPHSPIDVSVSSSLVGRGSPAIDPNVTPTLQATPALYGWHELFQFMPVAAAQASCSERWKTRNVKMQKRRPRIKYSSN